MVRKIGAVVLLVLAGIELHSMATLAGFVFQLRDTPLSAWGMVYGVFVLLTAIFLVSGMLLWEWSRWRMLLGVVFTAAGGFSALGGAVFLLLIRSPQWKLYGISGFDEVFQPLATGWAASAPLFLATGIPLIILQGKRDKKVPNSQQSIAGPSDSTAGSPL